MSAMASTGAIPKIQRRQTRRHMSEITNKQYDDISYGSLLSKSYGHNTIATGSNVKKELSKAKRILEELKEKVEQMKSTISDLENMNPSEISFLLETKRSTEDENSTKRVRFQDELIFPIREMREVEQQIADTERKIKELRNGFSNRTLTEQTTQHSDEYPPIEIAEKDTCDYSRGQTLSEKGISLRKWPNTENLDEDISVRGKYFPALTFEDLSCLEKHSGPSRQLPKLQKPMNKNKRLNITENIMNDESMLTSPRRLADSDDSSGGNTCVDCEISRDQNKYIEPKIVTVSNRKMSLEEKNSVEVDKELQDVTQISKEQEEKEKQVLEIAIERDEHGKEIPKYIDVKAYDFIDAISKMKPQDVDLKENKIEEPNCLAVLQDVNKSLCCEDDGVDNLRLRISQLSVAALQSTKLIEMCMKNPHTADGLERIEAESILLLSGLKQEMLNEKLVALNNKNESLPNNGCLKISEIRMPLIYSPEAHPNMKRYYMVVFQGGDQLFSSGVLEPNRHSYLEISETFIFEDLPADFVIKVSVYSMYIEKPIPSNQDRTTCLPLKFMRDFFTLTNRRSVEETPIICWEQRETSFILHGQCEIKLSNLHKSPFTINGVPPTICLVNTMECKIETAVSLTNSERGFLNIGSYREDGKVSWRRQWCVLNGSKMKLWNNKQDENNSRPDELNLSRCLVQWECTKRCVCN